MSSPFLEKVKKVFPRLCPGAFCYKMFVKLGVFPLSLALKVITDLRGFLLETARNGRFLCIFRE